MQRSSERVGASIFDAASAPVRLQILRLLSIKGSLQYTEIMFQLKLDPVRDAGKFVYHLRSLTSTGLVTLDKKTKKYELTELGRMIVSFARDMDEYVNVKRGKLYVRTSRLAIEEFHRNKIAKSLVVEAGVPQEIADEIAAEAEDRLIRLRTVYLTAPLIREFVNAILIEKRLEEYRHKLTRLGMPVYDVAQLIRNAGDSQLSADFVHRSSAKSVLSEYVLLNCLPHKLADAHLSGSIHIANLENWILKPNEIVHDLRYFLRNSLPGTEPPETFEGALTLVRQVLDMGSGEVSGEQTLEYLNTFLAPYVRGRKLDDTTKALTYFLTSIRRDITSGSPQSGTSFTIDLEMPEFLSQEEAIGPGGKVSGHYADFQDESFRLAEATVEAFRTVSEARPPIQPHLIIRIRHKELDDPKTRKILEKAHELAASRSVPYFELIGDGEKSSYSATGLRISDDWTGHWDADCIRTGSMDTIFLNLPRIAYNSKKSDEKFLALLKESISLSVEGFKAKKRFVGERLKQPLLPLLAGGSSSAPYFYEKNASYNLSLIGISEAVEAHTGQRIDRDKIAVDFGLRILEESSKLVKDASEEADMRIRVSQRPGDEAVGRLAELDIEEYGRAVIVADGSRGLFHYTDMPTVPLTAKVPIEIRLRIESKFQSATPGGHLSVICTAPDSSGSGLLKTTEAAFQAGCKFLTYTSNYSACTACGNTDRGTGPKCGKCGSDKLTYIGRASYGLLPFNLWPESKRRSADKRIEYTLAS
ncbi:MAG: anaerobic ribonucleoside-triphosphate reductase [Candidatus Bathyarchaeia archaeon]